LRAAVAVLATLLACHQQPLTVAGEGDGLPGAAPRSIAVATRLAAALAARGPGHVPRTRHQRPDGSPRYTNRLILEASPYLLQHAHNPVDWYPWGDEAFELAARTGRPVLLSIGYSTCHWCHVMEEESFEDLEIAAALNRHYVAIKVDREERPDIDSIYMKALEATGVAGGWPLNVWLTPDRRPFFAGTYFPPRAGVRGARVGFLEVLGRARGEYARDPAAVAATASRIAAAVAEASALRPGGEERPGVEIIEDAVAAYRRHFDRVDGGLRASPRRPSKFPSSLPIALLLRHARRAPAAEAVELNQMAALTLRRMAAGGIYDQIGGGFHRYSTDPRWLVPHFEKMLYDNARLAAIYIEAAQALEDPAFAGVAADTLAYLAREMRAPEGGFYAATDADSPGAGGEREEGAFFLWRPGDLAAVLDPEDARLARAYYGITEAGNWEGASIPTARRPLAEVAAELGLEVAVAERRLAAIRERLRAARQLRPAPARDDKILAGWNGLAILAFARAARARIELPGDLDAAAIAREAARFVTGEMIAGGRLRRTFIEGRAAGIGFADDHAYLIAGLIELFEATGEPAWLRAARRLQAELDRRFRAPNGAYYQSPVDGEVLLTREIPARDGALPSASSVIVLNLLELYELTGEPEYLAAADRLLAAFAGALRRDPTALADMLLAIDFRAGVPRQIVLVAPSARAELEPLSTVLARSFLPTAVVIPAVEGDAALAAAAPIAEGKVAENGRPTAYVCEQSRCQLPTSDPEVLARQLR
jgi:hypothetical protein